MVDGHDSSGDCCCNLMVIMVVLMIVMMVGYVLKSNNFFSQSRRILVKIWIVERQRSVLMIAIPLHVNVKKQRIVKVIIF